jgi:hypothetical protein
MAQPLSISSNSSSSASSISASSSGSDNPVEIAVRPEIHPDPNKSRRATYHAFNEYHMEREDLTMDQICTPRDGFRLQKHQQFLRRWTQAHPEWKVLLLFHQIGSGKTCSAITVAEAYPDRVKVKVIMPASLITNFTDELMTQCANNRYISPDDVAAYKRGTIAEKKRIFAEFERRFATKYELWSIERFRLEAGRHKADIRGWIQEFTANTLFIVDEVQHFINTQYSSNVVDTILTEGSYKKRIKGIDAVLLRLLTSFAADDAKFLLLSATPVVDNITQMRHLAQILNPNIPIIGMRQMADFAPYLRGKVSYFPKMNDNAYPRVVIVDVDVPISPAQDDIMARIQEANAFGAGSDDPDEEDLKEMYFSRQRQASLVCPDEGFADYSLKNTAGLKKYAPKILACIRNLKAVGKHLVYFAFVDKGIDVMVEALTALGWTDYRDDDENRVRGRLGGKDGMRFVTWQGGTENVERRNIKQVLNDPSNIDGRQIKVIIGSPAMKEGVSFLHIQHVHMVDLTWNKASLDQIEGRAIRFCSHVDVRDDHPPNDDDDSLIRRRVKIHRYILKPAGMQVTRTVDEAIVKIIHDKYEGTSAAENLMRKVAIDHYLFRELEAGPHKPMPADDEYPPGMSPVEFDDFKIKKHSKKKVDNCPGGKEVHGTRCKAGYTYRERTDDKGKIIHCCFKNKTKRKRNRRHTQRQQRKRPVNDMENPFVISSDSNSSSNSSSDSSDEVQWVAGPVDRGEGRADDRGKGRDDRGKGRADDRGKGRDDRGKGRADDRGKGRADDRGKGRADDRGEGRADDRGEGRADDRGDRGYGEGRADDRGGWDEGEHVDEDGIYRGERGGNDYEDNYEDEYEEY